MDHREKPVAALINMDAFWRRRTSGSLQQDQLYATVAGDDAAIGVVDQNGLGEPEALDAGIECRQVVTFRVIGMNSQREVIKVVVGQAQLTLGQDGTSLPSRLCLLTAPRPIGRCAGRSVGLGHPGQVLG